MLTEVYYQSSDIASSVIWAISLAGMSKRAKMLNAGSVNRNVAVGTVQMKYHWRPQPSGGGNGEERLNPRSVNEVAPIGI